MEPGRPRSCACSRVSCGPRTGRESDRAGRTYVPAALTPPSLSARSWLEGVRSRHDVDPFLALEQLAFEGELGRSCRALSFGNLRKLLLADALSSAADLIVIDEANIGLDTAGHQGMTELVTANLARGAAVVAAVQQGETMAGADSIVVVSDRTIRERDAGEVDIGFRGPPEHLDR